jgi:hypothetical protein
MAEFAELDFKSHNLISSVFIRFLAEETGSNFASGLNSQLQDMQADHKTLSALVERRLKEINRKLDSHTENLQKLCKKAELKYIELKDKD